MSSYAIDRLNQKIAELHKSTPIAFEYTKPELVAALKKLDEIQKKCSHCFEIVQLFNNYKRVCLLCDAEDKTYRKWGL